MRRGQPQAVPEALRHVIRPAGFGFDLVTHRGHVLRHFETLDEARDFYAWHCPAL